MRFILCRDFCLHNQLSPPQLFCYSYPMHRKGFAPIAILLIIAGILVIGGGIWYYERSNATAGGGYTNTTYHYSFKYPAGWTLYSTANLDSSLDKSTVNSVWVNKDVVGTTQSDFRFFISVDGNNPQGLSPAQWYAAKKPGDSFVYPPSLVSHQEETTFAGSPAYKLSYVEGPGNTYFVSHDGVMFVILVEEDSFVTSDIQKDFDYIISSFAFTD